MTSNDAAVLALIVATLGVLVWIVGSLIARS